MKHITLSCPVPGKLIPLDQVKDPVFSTGALGRGAAVTEPTGTVVAPFDGTITVFFPTHHAIGLLSDDGVEVLIHVGIDTVHLEGKFFTPQAAQGDKVTKGQLLLSFDAKAIQEAGYVTDTPVIVTNEGDFGDITVTDGSTTIVSSAALQETANSEESIVDQVFDDGAKEDASKTNTTPSNILKEEHVAKEILLHIGGVGNIKAIEHCATRLRLIVGDKSKIEEKAVENIDGVKGQFFGASQYQIILGTGFVNKVYEVIMRDNPQLGSVSSKDAAYEQMSLIQKASRLFGDVFVPIIPVLVATGLFMGVRGFLLSLGQEYSPTFLQMSRIVTDTAFAFLPALVTWSTMKRFGGSPVIGIVLGLMLVSPELPNAYAVAAGKAEVIRLSLFGLNIPIVGYQGSVLPALVVGIVGAKVQAQLKKIVPDVLDLIITPFMTLLIGMLLGLLVVGPIMHTIELAIFDAVRAFLALPYGIGGFVVGGLHQVIVVFGIHHVFNALEVDLLARTGSNMFNAIITGAIVAQGGAALAVAFKTKNKKKRDLYFASVVPAFLGITEPAIFGINLRFIKPFFYALIGGACAGMTASILHLAGTGMGITVIPGTLLYIGHLAEYLLVNVVGFGVSFALTYIFFKTDE